MEKSSEEVHFLLDLVPSYITPRPDKGYLKRNDDLSLEISLKANAPGCKQTNDSPILQPGEMGLAGLFKGTVGQDMLIEFHGWINNTESNFKSGEFEYIGTATEVRLFSKTTLDSYKCIVSCSSAPKIWGPNSAKIVLVTTEYKITIVQNPKYSSKFSCVTLEIESKDKLNDEIIEKILTSLSFVSGRRIAKYETKFLDQNNFPILTTLTRPRIYSAQEYNEASRNPFSNSPWLNLSDGEIWSQVLDLTLKFEKKIPLRNILINAWFARPIPLGGNLIFYNAALEALIIAWFKLPENISKSDRFPQDDFLSVISPTIIKIKELEKSDSRWIRVRKSIEESNKYSKTSKVLRFYNLLGLNIGEVEKAIREARDRFAHGADFSIEEDASLLSLTDASEALLNRTLLKLIGYEGKYVDYSTLGFPLRELSIPLGGPKGDGNFLIS